MKKYILNFKFLVLVIILTTFYSCEEMIEIDLPNNQINTEDVFKDIHTTQSALANLYINVRQTSFLNGGYSGIGSLLDSYCDNLSCFLDLGSNTNVSEFYYNSVLPNNYTLNMLWKNNYEHIYTINAFIEGLTLSGHIEEDDKRLFLGEAYFLRALYYQYLTQLFGNIPYTTQTDYKYNSIISRTSFEEVLKLVEKELETSLELVSDQDRNSERIYPNKAATELVLAKNYLLQKRYEQAVNTARNVLNNYSYALEEDVNKVFKKTAKSTIWQLGTNSTGSPTLEADNYIFKSLPPSLYALSIDLINSFNAEDKRFLHWTNQVSQNGQSWFHAYKYKNNNGNDDEYSIVLRIEEAYFVLIEALTYQNKTTEALQYLNIIRKRAGLLELTDSLSQSELIDAMLLESRREFFTEGGHRFFDLKRNNRLNVLQTTKSNWLEKHKMLPIPENDILLNPNLLPQNEGY